MAKKTAASSAGSTGATRKSTAPAKSRGPAASQEKTTASKASTTGRAVKKHVGDVLGLGRATASKSIPSGERRPKGIEITRHPTATKQARTVGGVRGRGR